MKQDLLTLPEHLRSPPVFCWVRIATSLFFYVVCCVLLCLFCVFAMALSVYIRLMSLDVPQIFFALLFKVFCFVSTMYLIPKVDLKPVQYRLIQACSKFSSINLSVPTTDQENIVVYIWVKTL